MLTDMMNNIYTRISQLAKSIQGLQTSLDSLNKSLAEKSAGPVHFDSDYERFCRKRRRSTKFSV